MLDQQAQCMDGRLPDFLGLGVQKGGTTSLQRLLEQHPGAFLPAAKEVHFFSLHLAEGDGWYRNQFATVRAEQLCGEITPYYLFHPQAPSRVKALVPLARLLVLLRDPVERVLSQFFHSRRLGLELLELEAALASESQRLVGANAVLEAAEGRHKSHQEHSYLSRSRYEEQLPRWQALFPDAQLLVLLSEDLFKQSEAVWTRLLSFLELDPWPLPCLGQPANAGRGEAMQVSPAVRLNLKNQLQDTYRWAEDQYGFTWDEP